MLSCRKLKKLCKKRKINTNDLAGYVSRGAFSRDKAASAIKNWKKGLLKPIPTTEDVDRLANGLGVETTEISEWKSSYRYAPSSARKARLVTDLISGRDLGVFFFVKTNRFLKTAVRTQGKVVDNKRSDSNGDVCFPSGEERFCR